jgi:hypothetical protein
MVKWTLAVVCEKGQYISFTVFYCPFAKRCALDVSSCMSKFTKLFLGQLSFSPFRGAKSAMLRFDLNLDKQCIQISYSFVRPTLGREFVLSDTDLYQSFIESNYEFGYRSGLA